MDKNDSKVQEKRLANLLSGRKTIASGALKIDQGDVETNDYLIECKITGKKSFSIKNDTLEKIRVEALRKGKTGIMHIDISGNRMFVIPEHEFLRLLEELK